MIVLYFNIPIQGKFKKILFVPIQVESRYANNWQDTSSSVVASENSEHLQKVLDDNVEQISSVRNQYYINYKLYNILNEHYNFFILYLS